MIERAVRITLREIKYDVKFDSWLREKVANQLLRNANEDAENVDYAYKNDKAEDWLVRQIQDAIDNVYGELAWCTIESEHFTEDSIDERPQQWEVLFRFSDAWRGSVRALRSGISTYVREYVLAQWYRAAMPENLASYEAKAEEALRKVYQEARSEVVQLEPWRL